MKPIFYKACAIALCGTLGACGNDKEEREETAGNQPNISVNDTGSALEDEEATSQVVTAQIDEGISSAADDPEDSAAALALFQSDVENKHERYRNCEASDDKAVVTIKRSLVRAMTFDNAVRSASTSVKAFMEKTRTWSKDGGSITCGPNNKAAVIPWSDIAGVKADVTFTHARSRESSATNKKKNTTRSSAFSFESTGTRSISWSAATSDDADVLAVRKIVTSSVTRNLSFKNKKGEEKTISGSVTAGSEAPISVLVERTKSDMKVVKRTIESGKIVAVNKSGERVETSFNKVVYTPENRCMASSGTISGAVYEKDANEPKLTYEVTFTGDSKTIVFSDGKEVVYSPDGCELDDPEEATEVDSADDVKAEDSDAETEAE